MKYVELEPVSFGDEPEPPRFPKAKVHMSEFMRVDAIFHMMLETVGKLRKAGATPEQIRQYRVEAINGNPYAVTPRWVSAG